MRLSNALSLAVASLLVTAGVSQAAVIITDNMVDASLTQSTSNASFEVGFGANGASSDGNVVTGADNPRALPAYVQYYSAGGFTEVSVRHVFYGYFATPIVQTSTDAAFTAPTTLTLSGSNTDYGSNWNGGNYTSGAIDPGQTYVRVTLPATGTDSWKDSLDTVTLTTVPEPTSLAVLSLAGLALMRRRR